VDDPGGEQDEEREVERGCRRDQHGPREAGATARDQAPTGSGGRRQDEDQEQSERGEADELDRLRPHASP
jgi:hypothetical protein